MAFVTDCATGVCDDLGDRSVDERFRVVRASGQWVGNVDGFAIKQTD
jgi:hypothetical protein